MKILFITSNSYKVAEAKSFFDDTDIDFSSQGMELLEIQSEDQEEIVSLKAQQAWDEVGKPLIVDDTGLYIKRLNKFPGTCTKQVLHGLGLSDVIKFIDNKEPAYYQTSIALHDGQKISLFKGVLEGHLINKIGGGELDDQAQFSNIFIPNGFDKTLDKLSLGDFPSHRVKALAELKKYLIERQ